MTLSDTAGEVPVETKNLKSFIAVYEQGSMAKASQELYISPQGLSKSIARLEADLGETLFLRTNRGVAPTPFATELYPKAREMVALADSIESGRPSDARTELVVASVSGFLQFFGRSFKEDFARTFPRISLRIEEGNDARVMELVLSGTAACGCVSGPVDYARFDALPLSRHPHVAVVRADDELAAKGSLVEQDLSGRRIAIMGPGFSPYNGIQNRLARAEVVPEEVVGVAEVSTGRALAARGEAICITVAFAADGAVDQGCAVVPFTDPEFTWDTSLIQRKGASSAEVSSFMGFAVDWYGRNGKEALGA